MTHQSTISRKSVAEFIREVKNQFREAERLPKLERDRTAYLCDMFYRGKHRVFLSPIDGWYKEIKPKPGQASIYHPENYFGALTDSNVTEIIRSQPAFVVRATKERERDAMGARALTGVAEHYQRQFFNETFKQSIAKRVQLHGTVGVYVYWDKEAGPEIEYEITEEVLTKVGDDGFVCTNPECGANGPVDAVVTPGMLGLEGEDPDLPMCPECGSEARIIEQPEIPQVSVLGRDKYKAGDISLEQVPIYELNTNSAARCERINGRTRFRSFNWLNRTRIIDIAQGLRMFPGTESKWRAAGAGLSTSDQRGNYYQQRLERTSGGTENDRTGYGTADSNRQVEYQEDWLMPDVLAQYGTAAIRHQLYDAPDAPWIEEGQTLEELFPNGMKICSSGEQIFAIKPEDARKHWRFFKWKHDPESFWGIPVVDAVPLQILLNESNSLITTNNMANETPRLVYNRLAIKRAELFSNPTAAIPIDVLPENMTARDVIMPLPSMSLGAGAYARPQDIRRAMQLIFGAAFLGASGEPGGENMRTASAWSIAQERALQRAAMIMSLLSESYGGTLEIVLRLFHENAEEERYISISGDYAEQEVLALTGSQLPVDFEITVKKGTSVPRADYQLRDDWDQFSQWEAQYIGSHGGIPPPPAILRQAAERYGVTTAASAVTVAGRAARRVLEGLRALAANPEQIVQQAAQAQMLQLQQQMMAVPPEAAAMMLATHMSAMQEQMQTPEGQAALILGWIDSDPSQYGLRIRKIGDKHLEMASWFEDWLNTDDGLNAEPIMVAMVEGRTAAHYSAMAEKQAQLSAMQQQAMMAANAPMMAAAVAASAEQQDSGEGGEQSGPTRDMQTERNAMRRAAPPREPQPK